MNLRTDHPELWASIVQIVREEIGLADWTEDEIAIVMRKVIAPDPDLLLDHLTRVLMWCDAAEKSGAEDARAAVDLWKHPDLPIEIMVDDEGHVSHRLDPDVSVEVVG